METFDTNALDLLEHQILEVEKRVYGNKDPPTENFNPVLDSLLTANTVMLSAVNGKENIAAAFRRLNELNDLLSNDMSLNCEKMESQIDVINQLCEIHPEKLDQMKDLKNLDQLLNEKHLKEVADLNTDVVKIRGIFEEKREKLKEIGEGVRDLVTEFNTICLEVSKTFVALNDAITVLEAKKNKRATIEID